MTDIEFPSGFAHQTSPTLANKVMIDGVEYTTLDDLAALLATSGGLADAAKAGQLVGAQQITTNDLLDIASSLHISIGANYISLPAQTAESVHWIYSDVGCGLVPLGYPSSTQTINGVADILTVGPGLHMLTGDGAAAWGVFDALGALAVTTGKVADGAITLAKLNSDTTNLAQATASLRAIGVGTPTSVGATSAAGTNTTASASDHQHAHDTQSDPTNHAAATTSANGFMTSAMATDHGRLRVGGSNAKTSVGGNVTMQADDTYVEVSASADYQLIIPALGGIRRIRFKKIVGTAVTFRFLPVGGENIENAAGAYTVASFNSALLSSVDLEWDGAGWWLS